MKINRSFSLKNYNQFGVDVQAKYFAQSKSTEDIQQLIRNSKFSSEKKIILGGGNNTLFVDDFNGLVIKPEIRGKEVIEQDDDYVLVKVGAGEDWDKLVRWVVKQGWGGIENLVMIPGTVGGAVSQGIGAYGQEAADVVEKVQAVDLETGDIKAFDNKGCKFGYHTSIFKEKFKNKYLITYVWFSLTPISGGYKPSYEYNSLKQELKKQSKPPYSLSQVMEAVIAQRQKNLPDIDHYGTCGCFFTNPVISKEKYEQLLKKIPNLVSYPSGKNNDWVKIPAGRIIDELGWRGHWEENVGVSEKHALCLVTNRQASGQEILGLANKIKQDVLNNYGVKLDFEVNIV